MGPLKRARTGILSLEKIQEKPRRPRWNPLPLFFDSPHWDPFLEFLFERLRGGYTPPASFSFPLKVFFPGFCGPIPARCFFLTLVAFLYGSQTPHRTRQDIILRGSWPFNTPLPSTPPPPPWACEVALPPLVSRRGSSGTGVSFLLSHDGTSPT